MKGDYIELVIFNPLKQCLNKNVDALFLRWTTHLRFDVSGLSFLLFNRAVKQLLVRCLPTIQIQMNNRVTAAVRC